jgi:putative exosortase-associated protein (TIGR04073 family)
MKKNVLSAITMFLFTVCFFMSVNTVCAQDNQTSTYTLEPAERFGRGVANIISSPLELPAQMYKRALCKKENNGNVFAILGGFFEGIAMGIIHFPWRLGAGVYDVTTFAFQECNECIISPEYLSFSIDSLETDRKQRKN